MANDIFQLCLWDGRRERLSRQPRLRLLFVRKGETDKLKFAERGPQERQAERNAWGWIDSQGPRAADCHVVGVESEGNGDDGVPRDGCERGRKHLGY